MLSARRWAQHCVPNPTRASRAYHAAGRSAVTAATVAGTTVLDTGTSLVHPRHTVRARARPLASALASLSTSRGILTLDRRGLATSVVSSPNTARSQANGSPAARLASHAASSAAAAAAAAATAPVNVAGSSAANGSSGNNGNGQSKRILNSERALKQKRKRLRSVVQNLNKRQAFRVEAFCTAEGYRFPDLLERLHQQYTVAPYLAEDVIHVRLRNPHGAYTVAEAFFFSNGTFVTWGATELQNTALLKDVKAFEINAYAQVATEMFYYLPLVSTTHVEEIRDEDWRGGGVLSPSGALAGGGGGARARSLGIKDDDVLLMGDTILLRSDPPPADAADGGIDLDGHAGPGHVPLPPTGTFDGAVSLGLSAYAGGPPLTLPQRQLAVSSALMRSAKLECWEEMLDTHLAKLQPIPEALSRASHLPVSRAQILQNIGELFALRGRVNLHSDLLSAPDFCWSSDRMETVFETVSRNLEVKPRIAVFNKKLDYANELAEVMRNHGHDHYALKLEWAIIVLIAVEIVFELIRWGERYGLIELAPWPDHYANDPHDHGHQHHTAGSSAPVAAA